MTKEQYLSRKKGRGSSVYVTNRELCSIGGDTIPRGSQVRIIIEDEVQRGVEYCNIVKTKTPHTMIRWVPFRSIDIRPYPPKSEPQSTTEE